MDRQYRWTPLLYHNLFSIIIYTSSIYRRENKPVGNHQIQTEYVCVCMYGHHMYQSMDQPGKVANPARGQLNREK